MNWAPASAIQWLFAEQRGGSSRLIPRWLFLRGLGLIYFSAFFSTIFQIQGLIGAGGILPAGTYLDAIAEQLGTWQKFWYAPTLLWWSSGSFSLSALCWIGMLASVLLVLNFWPRGMLVVCLVCFLSFVAAAQDFSSYQSDGMLLEAGAISLFFAPPGFRPGLGANHPASRASLFLLIWEWFRIYFESGAVKLLSGDPQWRNYTALDEYYQNGPLPTWIGWYVQHLPHWFHAATVYLTLSFELGLIWVIFLPRRWRIASCLFATFWQIGIILTANYAFLNYIVLLMGVLLLDDRFVLRILPQHWKELVASALVADRQPVNPFESWTKTLRGKWHALRFSAGSVMLLWIFYVTFVELIWMFAPVRLPAAPVNALEPFRIANRYGLFAVMTRGRYEIEFQGSADGQNWVVYPFRFKPQDLDKPPGIYAPYQPRFEWNLWFASLGSWREYVIVPNTEVQLLSNAQDVVGLFATNPFPHDPPHQVRVVLWRYWFTSMAEKRATRMWWRREMLGLYAPTLQREPDGKIRVVDWPTAPTPQ